MDDSDFSDDDSDDDETSAPRPAPSSNTNATSAVAKDTLMKSKNQALYEAATKSGGDDSPGAASFGLAPTSATTSRGPSPGPPAYEEEVGRGNVTPSDDKKKHDGGFAVANPSNPSPPNAGGRDDPLKPASQPAQHPSLHPQHNTHNTRRPAPSITPPPAAPLQVHIPAHQMNAPQPQRPIPQAARGGPPPQQQPGPIMVRGPPQALVVDTRVQNAGPYPAYGGGPMPMSGVPFGMPGFHMNPTPTPADSSSPIVPAFIKPIRPAFVKFDDSEKTSSVMSHESSMPIMRGEKEDYLPIRSGTGTGPRAPRVGQRMNADGDDFWRRFSMVAKMDKRKPANDKRRCVLGECAFGCCRRTHL